MVKRSFAIACVALGCALPEATKVDGGGMGGAIDTGGSGGTITTGGGMGGMVTPGKCDSDRGPTMVEVPWVGASYCVDSTEVTRDQYGAFFTSVTPGDITQPPECAFNTNFTPGPQSNPASSGDHPVGSIDWCDAWSFCNWAGKRLCGAADGRGIPFIVVPEINDMFVYACTAGGTRDFPYGDTHMPGACNDASLGQNTTVAAGSLETCEGGFAGLFDMYGNLVEWIDNCEAVVGGMCVVRGGSFVDSPVGCTGYFTTTRDSAADNLGFRCCR